MICLNTTRSRLFVLVLLAIIYTGQPALVLGQSDADHQLEWVRAVIDSTMRAENIPALSIGVILNGELVYVDGFGNIARDSEEKVDGSTLYQIGSDTKKLTAIIAKNLVLEGQLDFDEPIVTHVEGVLTEKALDRLKEVTLRQLLVHRSGVPYRAPTNRRIDGNPMLIPYTEKDLINDLNNMELVAEPGTDSGYSNFGYAIAGYICERASGESYAKLLHKYVANELGMENTMVVPSENQISRIAAPYLKENRMVKSQPWKMGLMTAAGGVYSNIHDSAKLLMAQLAAYRTSDEVSDKGHPLILTDRHEEEGRYYGFGLGKTVYEHGARYGHGGDLDGFASAYIFSPEENGGLVFFTTSGGGWVGRLESQLYSRLFGQE